MERDELGPAIEAARATRDRAVEMLIVAQEMRANARRMREQARLLVMQLRLEISRQRRCP